MRKRNRNTWLTVPTCPFSQWQRKLGGRWIGWGNCWLVQRLNQWDSFQGWVPHLLRKRHRQQMHKRRRAARSARPSRDPRTIPAMAPGPRVEPGRNQEKGNKENRNQSWTCFLSLLPQPSARQNPGIWDPHTLTSLNVSWMTVMWLAFCKVVKIHWWVNQDTCCPWVNINIRKEIRN